MKDVTEMRKLIEKMRAVLVAYERWEGDLVMDGDWDTRDGMPKFTEDLYDRFMEIQAMRNDVLGRFVRAPGGR